MLERTDAWEYLANSREAWKSEDKDSAIEAAAGEEIEEGEDDDQEEAIDEEPLSQLIERLDATVFGLIEALDAGQAELPDLLDEALKGSLWARQIEREGEGAAVMHKKILAARARLIWLSTTPQARHGHFAMGVGLEAGLAIDAMADELGELLDRADLAALLGDNDELSESLAGLAERLLVMRPFIPDMKNALPLNWKEVLYAWVSGADVEKIGAGNMKVVEDAFMYRLVWAPFKRNVAEVRPSLLSGIVSGDSALIKALRIGRGKARWPRVSDE